jgi:hypothetical protein
MYRILITSIEALATLGRGIVASLPFVREFFTNASNPTKDQQIYTLPDQTQQLSGAETVAQVLAQSTANFDN